MDPVTEAEVVRLSFAALVGVGALLVVLRWLPISASLLLGVGAGSAFYCLSNA